jgi:hypothetical protein
VGFGGSGGGRETQGAAEQREIPARTASRYACIDICNLMGQGIACSCGMCVCMQRETCDTGSGKVGSHRLA